MKIVYMGTPDFAVAPLEALIQAGHQIIAVVTQPDKPKGRGKEVQVTPVKECALVHQIPVFQPIKIKEKEAVEQLRTYGADVFVVAAFGQLLSKEILDMPQFGCINIHASLLPKYRGAAPIQRVILDGEAVTGVTIMQMDVGLDTGDMLLAEEVVIEDTETGDSLHDKLSEVGAKLIVEALVSIEENTCIKTKQDDSKTCYAKMLQKTMGNIEWNKSAVEIERLIRGLNSWPSAYTFLWNKMLKIWSAKVVSVEEVAGLLESAQSGEIIKVDKESVYVQTGNGVLQLLQLQIEGKKRMTVKEFMMGKALETGTVFESEKK